MATEHFTDAELSCRCGCGLLPSSRDQERLEAFRVALGEPMILTSAMRCPDHNERVSSTKSRTGPHTFFAVDVAVLLDLAQYIVWLAMQLPPEEFRGPLGDRWWSGIGLRQHGPNNGRIVHLDNMPSRTGAPRPLVWTYR